MTRSIKNLILSLVFVLSASGGLNASILNESQVVEVTAVSFRDLKICHQKAWRNLSVQLEYQTDASERVASQEVRDHVKAFLEAYANPMDFWEVMNTRLTLSLAEDFPSITTLKSSLSLAPDQIFKSPRASFVTYAKDADHLKESFQFTKRGYLICQTSFRSLDLRVSWEMRENIDPSTDYPDYQWVDAAIEAFFAETPLSSTEWKTLKPELQSYLLEKFPGLASIEIDLKIAE